MPSRTSIGPSTRGVNRTELNVITTAVLDYDAQPKTRWLGVATSRSGSASTCFRPVGLLGQAGHRRCHVGLDSSRWPHRPRSASSSQGTKRATAGSVAAYEVEGETLPQAGDFEIVTDGAMRPRAVLPHGGSTSIPTWRRFSNDSTSCTKTNDQRHTDRTRPPRNLARGLDEAARRSPTCGVARSPSLTISVPLRFGALCDTHYRAPRSPEIDGDACASWSQF